jgi:hypothetical protein
MGVSIYQFLIVCYDVQHLIVHLKASNMCINFMIGAMILAKLLMKHL